MNENKCIVTGTVNAGVCLLFPGNERLWIDFYPDAKAAVFSDMTPEEWEFSLRSPALFPPDLILFTHTHRDHFSISRTLQLHVMHPGIPILCPKLSTWDVIPEDPGSSVPLPETLDFLQFFSGETFETRLGALDLRFFRTLHSGAQYASVPHYSLLLTYRKKQIFISGDASLTGEELLKFLEEHRIDLAILTFPWAATSAGREAIEAMIQPAHVLLYHLPKEADDLYGFRKAAQSGASLLNVPDVRVLLEPFQSEAFLL